MDECQSRNLISPDRRFFAAEPVSNVSKEFAATDDKCEKAFEDVPPSPQATSGRIRKRQKKSRKSTASPNTTDRIQSRPPRTRTTASGPEKETRIEQALRAWRLSEAKRTNIPAFRIFGNRALKGRATCPHNDAELLAVPGIGMSIVQKYGAHIYRLIAGSR
jgi:superfamily II DNA helicase RecQ